ncbi:N-acetylneuraminate lyase isoform X6 [Papio anubis]|uniref:N-acetylneuraminate lyase isoform X6 n=1 Tax=Papio anubis TaxID=9555 RepID=UPI0004F1F112|nr:N-acetylneuraminate lyase isoform X6 [Papio anubis]
MPSLLSGQSWGLRSAGGKMSRTPGILASWRRAPSLCVQKGSQSARHTCHPEVLLGNCLLVYGANPLTVTRPWAERLDQVVIHVGALSLKESQELAQHAAEIGADGIAVIAPFFLKPWTKDILINFLKEVAAAAPALPFYYYHIPALTGVKIRAEELLDGIQDKIPTFQGLKFSDTDLLDFGQCVDQNRQQQFAFLFGVDEQLLSALVMGATGAVGSTYNYLGKKTNQMLEAFERKDLSLALNYQFCIQRFINFVVKLGFGVSQTKAIMTLVSGIPMGPPRLPLQKASREFTDSAEAKLKSLDFLSFTDLKDGSLEASS